VRLPITAELAQAMPACICIYVKPSEVLSKDSVKKENPVKKLSLAWGLVS